MIPNNNFLVCEQVFLFIYIYIYICVCVCGTNHASADTITDLDIRNLVASIAFSC